MKINLIKTKFVRYIPDEVADGILYISIPYGTAIHKCPCGCGEIVVTPIKPADWNLLWNGETVTLKPSIGNWSLPCRSHYWIIENKIIWASKWDGGEVDVSHVKKRKNTKRFGRTRLSRQRKQ